MIRGKKHRFMRIRVSSKSSTQKSHSRGAPVPRRASDPKNNHLEDNNAQTEVLENHTKKDKNVWKGGVLL